MQDSANADLVYSPSLPKKKKFVNRRQICPRLISAQLKYRSNLRASSAATPSSQTRPRNTAGAGAHAHSLMRSKKHATVVMRLSVR